MKSTSFSKENNDTFKGFFKLTIRGITKDVAIPFPHTESGNKTIFQTSFSLNRRDYNAGRNSLILADDGTINIVISGTKQ